MRYRPDIEGLRGLAVILVIFSHLAPENRFLAGGFVGVDVFFVISGFLITNLLMSEYEKRYVENEGYGWISIRSFYFRRARRILPAAILVLASILFFSFFFANQVKFQMTLKDSIFALVFVANWNLISEKTDYFQKSFDISPVQHYWSLAVEEQFYLVFPAIFVFAVFFKGLKLRNFWFRWYDRLAILLLGICVLSFSWSLLETFDNPINAYFSTITRAWEISLGAFIAASTFKRDFRDSLHKSTVFGVFGFSILIYSAIELDGESVFPGFNALFPTVAASLFILAGMLHQGNFVTSLLSRKPIVFTGKISYSLYLWHWPIIVFGDRFLQTNIGTFLSMLILSLVILGASILTYYLVEKPFRKFEPPSIWSKQTLWESIQRDNTFNRGRLYRPWVFVCSMVAILLFFGIFNGLENKRTPQGSQLNESQKSQIDVTPSPKPTEGKPNSERQVVKKKAIEIELLSSYELALQDWQKDLINVSNSALSKDFLKNPLLFLKYGESPDVRNYIQKAYVFGDSHAYALIPLLNKSRVLDGYKLINNSLPCQIANMPSKNERADCPSLRESFFSTIVSEKPSLVFLTDSAPGYIEKNFNLQQWRTSLEETIKIVSKNSGSFVLFGTVPFLNKSTIDCFDQRGNIISGCVGNPKTNESFRNYQKFLASKYGGKFIDTSKWLCSNDSCPSFVNGYPVFSDNQHLSVTFSRSLSTLLDSFLSAELPK